MSRRENHLSSVSLGSLLIINAHSRLLGIFLPSFWMISFASAWLFNMWKAILLVSPVTNPLCFPIPSLLSSEHQSMVSCRTKNEEDAEYFPTPYLNGVLRDRESRGLFEVIDWLVCLKTEIKNLTPRHTDFRIYSIISFS